MRVVWQFVLRFCEDWWKIGRLKPCLSVDKSRVSTFSNLLSLLSVSLSHPTAPRWSDVRLQFVSIFVWIAWWDLREDAETDLSRASWVERSEVSTKKHQTIVGSLFWQSFSGLVYRWCCLLATLGPPFLHSSMQDSRLRLFYSDNLRLMVPHFLILLFAHVFWSTHMAGSICWYINAKKYLIVLKPVRSSIAISAWYLMNAVWFPYSMVVTSNNKKCPFQNIRSKLTVVFMACKFMTFVGTTSL